jgi:hypothetical protein
MSILRILADEGVRGWGSLVSMAVWNARTAN